MKSIHRYDSAYAKGLANGWKPNTYRIVSKNGGYALEEQGISMPNGDLIWKQVAWSWQKEDMDAALKLRTVFV